MRMQHQTPSVIRLEEGARVLFLTKDLELLMTLTLKRVEDF